jgi:hypothetical protein
MLGNGLCIIQLLVGEGAHELEQLSIGDFSHDVDRENVYSIESCVLQMRSPWLYIALIVSTIKFALMLYLS